jgi:hypothetical protein
MLKLDDFEVKKDMLIVVMEDPQVDEVVGGVHLSQEEVQRKKANTTIRIGKVIKHGVLTEETLNLLSLWGNSNMVNQNIIFEVHALNPFDLPIEEHKNQPIIHIKLDYVLGIINEENEAK